MQNTDRTSKRAASLRHFISTIVAAGVALFFLGGMSAQSKDKEHARPFRFTGIELPGTTAPDGMSGTWVHAGNATHMGKTRGEGTYEVLGNENGVWFLHTLGTYTAANGDTIIIEGASLAIDYNVVPPVGIGTFEVVGGTGRFANARGSLVGVGIYYETPEVSMEGTISY
jgi:hypothetical protein